MISPVDEAVVNEPKTEKRELARTWRKKERSFASKRSLTLTTRGTCLASTAGNGRECFDAGLFIAPRLAGRIPGIDGVGWRSGKFVADVAVHEEQIRAIDQAVARQFDKAVVVALCGRGSVIINFHVVVDPIRFLFADE